MSIVEDREVQLVVSLSPPLSLVSHVVISINRDDFDAIIGDRGQRGIEEVTTVDVARRTSANSSSPPSAAVRQFSFVRRATVMRSPSNRRPSYGSTRS